MTYSPGTPEYQVNEYIARSAHFVTIPTVLLNRLLKKQQAEIAALQTEVDRLQQALDENESGEVADRLMAHLKSGEREALEAEIDRLRLELVANLRREMAAGRGEVARLS